MNNPIHTYLGTALFVLATSSVAQTNAKIDAVAETIEANIASTLKDACMGKESIEFLNCRLREPRDDRYANDAKIYAQMASVRNRWNLWLSQSPYLPFEMRQDRIGGTTTTQGNTPIPQSHIAPTFLPKDIGLKWSVTGSFELKYQTSFDIGNILSSKSSNIPAPPNIGDNLTIRMAGNE